MEDIQLKEFHRRRTWNWIILGMMYAFFYMSRYNFASAHPILAEQFGWGYTDYGKILTPALIVYGLSVFLNGPICDKIGGKLSILIGTAGAAIANLLFGCMSFFIKGKGVIEYGLTMSTMISMMAVIWVMNNYFQSFGALSVIKINTKWFHVHERGRLAGFFSIPIQFGRFLGTIVCSALVFILPWQYIFWIPAALLGVMFFIGKKYMFEAPEELGFQYFNTATMDKEKVRISLVLKKVFTNSTMWTIAALSMCLGIVRNSIDHWYARYFQVMFHIGASKIITFAPYKLVAASVPIVMIVAGFIAGYASDTKFQGRRGPIVFFSFLGQLVSLFCLYKFIYSPWLAAISLILLLGFTQGGHCLIAATAAMDFGGRKAAATATGFIDGMQYLAGAFVGYGMGKLLDAHKVVGNIGAEFQIWPLAPIIPAVVGIILAISIWNALPSKDAH